MHRKPGVLHNQEIIYDVIEQNFRERCAANCYGFQILYIIFLGRNTLFYIFVHTSLLCDLYSISFVTDNFQRFFSCFFMTDTLYFFPEFQYPPQISKVS